MEYLSDRLIKGTSACQQARTLRLAQSAQQIKSFITVNGGTITHTQVDKNRI